MSKLKEKCLSIAKEAHNKQKDKAGKPYIYHPLKVSEFVLHPLIDGLQDEIDQLSALEKEYCECIALLHDVIEDTDITYDDLLNTHQLPKEICDAVQLLSKDRCDPYRPYLLRVKENKYARLVKLADLTHNSDLSRLKTITEKDKERHQKYQSSIKTLL